jgi:hypothetical protein
METQFGSQKWENPQIMNPSIYEVSIWHTFFLNNQAIYRVVQQGQDLNLIFNKKKFKCTEGSVPICKKPDST